MRAVFIFVFLLTAVQVAWTQETKTDSLKQTQPADTSFIPQNAQVIEIESYAKRFDPRKALMYSAVFPGAGQAYNKKYWKMPLVYGGFGVLIYVASVYNELYVDYRADYFALINDPNNPTLSPTYDLTKDQLSNAINKTRRERDFFIILSGFWYLFQMVDAHVDAHLKEFDVNPKMQVRLEPLMENSYMTGRNTGIALKIRF